MFFQLVPLCPMTHWFHTWNRGKGCWVAQGWLWSGRGSRMSQYFDLKTLQLGSATKGSPGQCLRNRFQPWGRKCGWKLNSEVQPEAIAKKPGHSFKNIDWETALCHALCWALSLPKWTKHSAQGVMMQKGSPTVILQCCKCCPSDAEQGKGAGIWEVEGTRVILYFQERDGRQWFQETHSWAENETNNLPINNKDKKVSCESGSKEWVPNHCFRSLKGPDKEPSKQGNEIGSDSTCEMLALWRVGHLSKTRKMLPDPPGDMLSLLSHHTRHGVLPPITGSPHVLFPGPVHPSACLRLIPP